MHNSKNLIPRPAMMIISSVIIISSLGVSVHSQHQQDVEFPNKCCPFGKSIVVDTISNNTPACLYTVGQKNWNWTGFLYNKESLTALDKNEARMIKLQSKQKPLFGCKYLTINATEKKANATLPDQIQFKLLSDGTVLRHCNSCPCKKWIPISTSNHCIDGIGSRLFEDEMTYSGSEQDQVLIVLDCFDSERIRTKHLETLVMVLLFFSWLLYLVTGVALIISPEKQTGSKLLTSLVASRCFMCLFQGIAYVYEISGPPETKERTVFCVINGILAHFFMLASFTWLVVINVDIWLKFRDIMPLRAPSEERKWIQMYSLFAWTVPLVIVGISVVMNEVYRGMYYPSNLDIVPIPDYGNGQCFVAVCSRGPYLYYEIAILLLICIILSTLTLANIYQLRKSTQKVRNASNGNDPGDFFLYGKLSLLLGVTWTFEFISWMSTPENEEQNWVWTLIDIFNLPVTAILIFFLFAWKEVYRRWSERLDTAWCYIPSFMKRRKEAYENLAQLTPETQSTTDFSSGNK